MTVRINFLPTTYKPPKQIDSKGWMIVAASAVALVTTGVYYTNVYAGTAALERATESAQGQLQGIQSELARAALIGQRETKVAQAEDEVKSLTGRYWSGVLLDLRDSTPKHVTWTSLEANGDKLLLKGTSRGLIDVAQFLGSLVNDPQIEEVWLHYANEEGQMVTVTVNSQAPDSPETTVAPPDPSVMPPDLLPAGGVAQPENGGTQVVDLGAFRQFSYELEITLVTVEGGKKRYGT